MPNETAILLLAHKQSAVAALFKNKPEYKLTHLSSYKAAEAIIEKKEFRFIIAELSLPEGDAISFGALLKSRNSHAYYIILSSDGSAFVEREAYRSGAHDYIQEKDYANLELKIKNILRLNGSLIGLSANASITVDEEKYAILKNNQYYYLPVKEFEIVKLFLSNPQKIFSRTEIAEKIWKDRNIATTRVIDVHVTHIRKAIGKESIRSVKNVGYGISGI